MAVSADQIRAYLLQRYASGLKAKGVDTRTVPDNFDLLLEGIVDSLGVMEMLSAVEAEFGLGLDYGELDPEDLTRIGPLARYIASNGKRPVS